jgi:hypothetical protein
MVKLAGGQVLFRAAAFGCMVMGSGLQAASVPALPSEEPNTLTQEERDAGWKLMFNGQDLAGWRPPLSGTVAPTGWTILDGSIANTLNTYSSIVSTEVFDNFELSLEWKVGKGGNGGLFYRVWKEDADIQHVSPQAQIIDNEANIYGTDPNTWAGACAWLYPPAADMTRPVGEFNKIRIVVVNNHVEHWLNGTKVVEYVIGSADWKARLSRSPLSPYQDLGSGFRGRIGLQHLTNLVRFRNIKIRPMGIPQGVLSHRSARRPQLGARAWGHFPGASSAGEFARLSVMDLKGRTLVDYRRGKANSPADQIIFIRAAGE